MKDNTYYFSHDYNASQDPKVMYLLSKHNIISYGIYWIIIEILHQSDDGKFDINLLGGVAFKYNIDLTELKNVIDTCFEIGLLKKTDDNFFYSERVLKNKEELANFRQKKSNAGKIGMAKRWGNNNTVITNDNTVITKHNKVKESKVKESKVNINTLSSDDDSLFTFNKKLQLMFNSKDWRMVVIANYWQYRYIEFDSLEKYKSGLKRELRPVNSLKGYPIKRIKEVMFFLNGQDWIGKWTLETVHKYVDEDLNKIIQKYEN